MKAMKILFIVMILVSLVIIMIGCNTLNEADATIEHADKVLAEYERTHR